MIEDEVKVGGSILGRSFEQRDIEGNPVLSRGREYIGDVRRFDPEGGAEAALASFGSEAV